MADFSEQLSAMLNDPAAQANIKAMLSSLQGNANGPPQEKEPPPFDFSGIFGTGTPQKPKEEPPGFDINMLMKMQKIFSAMNKENSGIDLLRALRPHLHSPEKADEAINILRLLSVLPALGESGIFGGDMH